MEQLPPPVRRSLTKAVRAVLHGNLGGLDAPARLSKPEAAATATAKRAAKGGAPSSSSVQKSGSLASGPVGAVGLSAWTDRNRRGAVASGDRGVGQGGGEKSAEVGGDQYSGGGRHSGGEVAVRKARRGRARGAAARVEALLRLEFARAMADMLYGFTECLFFLHPDRPIFNGARFLQVSWWWWWCYGYPAVFVNVVVVIVARLYCWFDTMPEIGQTNHRAACCRCRWCCCSMLLLVDTLVRQTAGRSAASSPPWSPALASPCRVLNPSHGFGVRVRRSTARSRTCRSCPW